MKNYICRECQIPFQAPNDSMDQFCSRKCADDFFHELMLLQIERKRTENRVSILVYILEELHESFGRLMPSKMAKNLTEALAAAKSDNPPKVKAG